MAPKSKRNESRRSSILKPAKPRQPLQNVNFNSSSSENSPTMSKVKRRVSFAEKKHVKEFCHSTEQGTVWDNTYEEHDSILKEASTTNPNTETELKENTSEYTTDNDRKHITFESSSNYSSGFNIIVSNQLCESITELNKEDNDVHDLDFTNPVEGIESPEKESQLKCMRLPCQNASDVSCTSIISNNLKLENSIVVYNDIDEECTQLFDLQHRQTAKATLSNIVIYKDSDEENCTSNADNKYSKSCDNNSKFDTTLYAQDLSMELTIAIPPSLLTLCSHIEEQKSVQKDDEIVCQNNLGSSFTNQTYADCNNASMKTLSNLQSSIVSKSIVSEHIRDDHAKDSIVSSFTVNTDIYRTNNIAFNTSMEITAAVPSKTYDKIIQHSSNKSIINKSELKDQTGKTELFNDVLMEMTKPVNIKPPLNTYSKEILNTDGLRDKTIFFHNESIEMTKEVSKNKQEITDIITCKPLKKNLHRGKDINDSTCFNEKTKLLQRSMEFTEAVPISSYQERTFNTVHSMQSTQRNTHEKNEIDKTELCNDSPIEMTNTCDKENLKINEPTFGDNRTMVFHNASMEMTKTVSSKNKPEITDVITYKSFKENAQTEKDMNNSTCFNEGTKLLQRSMEFTEAVPVSSYQERTFNIVPSTQSKQRNTHEKNEIDRTEYFNDVPMEMTNICTKENLRINEPTFGDNRTMVFHNASMEMTKTVSSRNKQEITDVIISKSFKENAHIEKDMNNSTCFNKGTKLLQRSMEFTEAVPVSSYQERTFNIVPSTQSKQRNTHEKNEINRTEYFNDVPMEMTNICTKENLKINEPTFGDNRTMVFHNASMEMTKAVSSKNKQEITDVIISKSFKENSHKEKDMNDSTCLNEKTKLLQRSMEFTEAIPISSYQERTFNIVHSMQSTQRNTHEKNEIDKTELCNDSPIEMTNTCDKENLKINEPTFGDNRTMVFHNASMEMTKTVSSKNKQEITDVITSKSFKENSHKEKDMNDSTCLNEKTKLLQRSMEFTEAIPISSYQERTFNIVHSMQSTQRNIHEKNQIDKTELCNDSPIEMTNTCDKENLKINEPTFGDNRTMVFHNASMEMTKTVSSKNKQEITDVITSKSFKENSHKEKDMNDSTCLNEKTKLLQRSMEFTEAIPISSYQERTFNIVHSMQSTQRNTHEKNEIDITELCNDSPIEMTNTCDKENLKINEPTFGDNRTMVFHNASMEMTKTVSSKNKQEITDVITSKSFKENSHKEKDMNDLTCLNEKTKLLQRSMEFTEAVPVPSYQERTFNIVHSTQSAQRNTYKKNEIDGTNICDNLSMEMTNICKENLKMNESTFRENRPMFFHDISMEMTKMVTSKNREDITNCMSISKQNSRKGKDTNDSINLNENNISLLKSMEFTEAILTLPCHERTLNTVTQSSSLSQTLSSTHFPVESSTELILQNDAETNRTIPNTSMEITAAVSTLHLTQNIPINKTKNLIISKSSESQNVITNNAVESRKSLTEENFKIPKKTDVETADMHNKLLNTAVASSSSNLDYSSNIIVKNVTGIKRTSESEESSPKKICTSFVKSRSCQESNIYSSPVANNNDDGHIKNVERDEHLVEDTINHVQFSESNLSNLNEISECSFLRKSLPYLGNNCMELQSIEPPSFLCSVSKDENSYLKNQLETTIVNDVINNEHNSDRLTTNIITESECFAESRKNVTQDHKNFTILKEKEESINIENNQTEHCPQNILKEKGRFKDNQETDCQATIRIATTIISNSRNNELNSCTIDIEKHNRKSILSTINHGKSISVPDIHEDQIVEKECIEEKTNDDAKLKSNIENQERCSDGEESLKTEQCVDHLKKRETIIEGTVDSKKYRENLNDELKVQRMEQEEKFADERLETEQCISANEDDFLQDPFLLLSQKLEIHAEREDCIWNVYHKNIDRKMIVFGFISNSLLIVTFLSNDHNYSEEDSMKEIKIISRVSDDTGVFIRIVHGLILEKINTKILTHLYRSQEDIFPMLDFVSQDVKLAMDFMFDLKRLDNLNLMEIARDEISFVARSKRMNIILRVAIKVKRFDKINSNDVNVRCLLGRIREADVKSLIKNVKKDHKFLRRYMNDVKDYIDIMEEISK